MTTYYHVAPSTYTTGEPLYSFIELWDETGEQPDFKWIDMDFDFYVGSMDAQVVCLFETAEEARDFLSEFLPTGVILEINLPEWWHDEGLRMDKVDEGYPCVYDCIPATLAGETIISVLE